MITREVERLAALRGFRVLDTGPEQGFDDLVRLAARIAGVPTALVSLVDADRQWFKARVGLDVCSTARDIAFCDHVVRTEQELEVTDARADPRFADNPLVTGYPHVVFYAGFPLTTSANLVMGTLCVISDQPMSLDDGQRDALRILARQVVAELELRRLGAEQGDELAARAVMEASLARSHEQYRLLTEHSTDIISRHGADGRVTYVSPAVRTVLGLDPALEVTKDARGQVHPEDFAALEHSLAQVQTGSPAAVTVRSRHANGSWRWLEMTLSPLLDPKGVVTEVFSAARDVTDRVETSQELARQAEFTRAVLDSVDVGIVACDAEGHLTLFNPATRAWHGISEDAGVAPTETARHFNLYEPDGVTLLTASDIPLFRALTHGQVRGAEIVIAAHGQAQRRVRCDGRALHDAAGRTVGAVVAMTDITAERRAAQEAQESSTFLSAVVAASPDYTFVADVRTGAATYGSPDKRLMGWTSEQLKALGPEVASLLVHPDDLARLTATNASSVDLGDGEVLQLRYRLRHVDGSWRWLSRRITPFRRGADGRVTEVLGVNRDVTDVVEAEDKLTHAAMHDHLTGFPNRLLLQDRLAAALLRAGNGGREVAVLAVDLDGFKRVNDTAGHAAGDAVLIETANRMAGVLRPQDTLARVGGDEFVIIIEPQNRITVPNANRRRDRGQHEPAPRTFTASLAERLNRAIAAPIVVNGLQHNVTASIGVTFALATGEESIEHTAERVLQDADAAMYRAKTQGKDRYRVFEDSLRTELAERGRVEQELRWALDRGDDLDDPKGDAAALRGLSVAYQPIIGCSGDVVGFEALARLTGRDGQSITPDVFIPLAEDTGLIRAVGSVVLDTACAQLADWRREVPFAQTLTMAVNISAIQAQRPDLAALVDEALARHGLDSRDLVLELTETAMLHATATAISQLARLREAGTRIAIDDFGTGYAPLGHLISLPITDVKIDKSFIAGVPHDKNSTRIVHAVAALAADLGLGCIVEGVETPEQRLALPPGVQLQGWLFSRALPADQIDAPGLGSFLEATAGRGPSRPTPEPVRAHRARV